MSAIQLRAFLVLTRPFFLLGGVFLYLLGVTFALASGTPFQPRYFLLGQALVTSVQLMVHYANEYYDQEVDSAVQDRTWFSGGSGALGSGVLPGITALRAAQVCLGIALFLFSTILVMVRSPGLGALLAVVLMALLASWFYSAPPVSLVSRGLGVPAASLVSALAVPLTGYLLQAGGSAIPLSLLLLCLPLVLVHMSMLLAFEFPDREADAAFGKRTLTVRLGPQPAAWLHHILLLLSFALLGVFAAARLLAHGEYLLFLASPLAVWQVIRLRWQLRHPAASYRWFTAGAVTLFGLAVSLVMVGLIIVS